MRPRPELKKGSAELIFVMVSMALVAVGVLASAIPARHAMRLGPSAALQAERRTLRRASRD